jgi:hypothetical protein
MQKRITSDSKDSRAFGTDTETEIVAIIQFHLLCFGQDATVPTTDQGTHVAKGAGFD